MRSISQFFQRHILQARARISNFARAEDGAIVAYIILMFLTMVLAAGMAVDFMRHESARADLQNALDRGALAAADFSQTISDKELIVEDYMRSSAIQVQDIHLNVVEETGINFSRVTASADYQVPTFFLKLAGIDTLTVAATGAAEQQKRKVEISLVLDVSNSMNSETSPGVTRLDQLQAAANEFIDTLVNVDTQADTSISIIPFSEYVRASANLAAQYNVSTHHSYNYCLEFDHGNAGSTTSMGDFAQMGLDPSGNYVQAQQIRLDRYGGSWSNKYACPHANNEIVALSNDATELHNRINSLQGEGWTAAQDGMKWATALLDPNSNSIVQGLIAAGDVDSNFSDRPLPYEDEGVLKIIVLMTDGANTMQYKIKPWKYDNHSVSYWNSNGPSSNKMQEMVNNGNNGKGDALMHAECAAARDNNMVVYTIGFELGSPSSAAAVALSQCASAPDNHFLVEGLEISSAFQTIAANIQKLKLIW